MAQVLRLLCSGALWLTAGLAGCALPGRMPPDALQSDVQTRLGPPTATYALATGSRWQYSQMPAGFEVHNLDFDAAGQLKHTEQVLTQQRLEQLAPGTSRHDVLTTFGAPMRVERVARFAGDIWTYRFRQLSDIRLAHIHLDPQGLVRQVLFTDELPNANDARH